MSGAIAANRSAGRRAGEMRDSLRATDEWRSAIVSEARSWIGTPYLHQGRVKGVGVDCAMLLLEVYERVGLVPHLELVDEIRDDGRNKDDRINSILLPCQIPKYPPDWMLHRGEERYLQIVERFARRLEDGIYSVAPKDGDLALYRWGRTISHGGIVDRWPRIIHAYSRSGKVEYGEGDRGEIGGGKRLAGFWAFWGNRSAGPRARDGARGARHQ